MPATENMEQARFNMIEQQIRPWDVLDPRVLEVIEQTRREAFVPARHRDFAFSDINIPLGHGEVMMAPVVEGRLLQAVGVGAGDEVLEVGTGSGYLAACLANLGGVVESVDCFEDFTRHARENLRAEGIEDVSLHTGDASAGWQADRHFDVIVITGSLPEVPETYLQQLKQGGRLFVIVGEPPIKEALLITRMGERDWARESLFETDIPPLRHAEQGREFVF